MAAISPRRGICVLATTLLMTLTPLASSLSLAATASEASPPDDASEAIAQVAHPIVSPHDTRDYRVITLDNGLEVLLVSDPEADKAAASMNVSVGSAQDPDDLQGLAHLLEHMLFLGTDAFPDSDAYQSYITQHGGTHNAFTASQDTNYFFEVEPKAFSGALERFSHFFIDPLFNADRLGNERQVVHSEYQSRLRDDGRRGNEVLDTLLNPANPTVGFSVGSTETLADRPKGEPSLRDRIIDFYQNHYGAGVMHLAIVAPLPMDTLTQLVNDNFSAIPNRGLERQAITEPLVDESHLPLAVEFKSLRDSRLVSFMFPVPDSILTYRTKPASYIANLLGHEGPGSLLSRLREEGWADALSAGVAHGDGQHALFSVDVSLTPEGAKHIDSIQASLFATVDLIRNQGISEARYDEQASLSEQAFQFQQHGGAMNEATRLSMSLTLYPLKDVNRAGFRMDGLDKSEVEDLLDDLRPERMLRLYSGPEVESEQRTTYYNVPWKEVSPGIRAADPLDGLALPEPNPFIAQDLSLLDAHQERPEILIDTDQANVWFKADNEFDTPEVSWRFSLQNPQASQTPRQAVLTQLLAGWLNDSLNEHLYAARLAGQGYDAYAHARGMTLSFNGWRDRQDKVIDAVLEQLQHGKIDDDSVARVRYGLSRGWRNAPQDPLYYQGQRILTETLMSPQWSPRAQLKALEGIDADDLRKYRDSFLANLHLQALAVGNADADLVQKEAEQVISALSPQLTADEIPDLEVLQADNLATLTPDSSREESLLLRYLQGPDQSIETQARVAVLGKLLETPFYQRLRTEQQLGYVVSAGYSPLLRAPGISLLVQSPTTRSEELTKHVAAFLSGVPEYLSELKDDELATYRQAVHDSVVQRDTSLGERANRLWNELSFGDTAFDRRERLAKAVLDVTPDELTATWSTLGQHVVDVAFDPGAKPSDTRDLKAQLPVLPEDDDGMPTKGDEKTAEAQPANHQ